MSVLALALALRRRAAGAAATQRPNVTVRGRRPRWVGLGGGGGAAWQGNKHPADGNTRIAALIRDHAEAAEGGEECLPARLGGTRLGSRAGKGLVLALACDRPPLPRHLQARQWRTGCCWGGRCGCTLNSGLQGHLGGFGVALSNNACLGSARECQGAEEEDEATQYLSAAEDKYCRAQREGVPLERRRAEALT